VDKVQEKSPLHYALVKKLQCLQPRLILDSPDPCTGAFKVVLKHMVEANKVNVKDCDAIVMQYADFTSEVKKFQAFRNFVEGHDRLDTLYYDVLAHQKKYSKLSEVLQKLLLLSHGQATVTKELLASVQASRQRYQSDLESKRVEKAKRDKCEKRKHIEEDVVCLKKKRTQLDADVSVLYQEADDLAEKAEHSRSWQLMWSNSHRRTAKEKACKVDELKKKI
jgi:hypothetical protein